MKNKNHSQLTVPIIYMLLSSEYNYHYYNYYY